MIDIAVVGARFGSEFVPIYRSHPEVGRVAIVDVSQQVLDDVGERYGVQDRFDSLEALLATDRYDAVHIATPVRFHVDQCVAVLESGRHVACAVPMATSFEGIRRIIEAQQAAGKKYMMMETMVFGREFLFARDLVQQGRLGPLTYLRGTHIQDLDGYARYWWGYPPMTYSTHALSPLLALAGARVEKAHGMGSGRLTADRVGDFDNPYPLETSLFRLDRDDLVAEVTVSFFQVARKYQEGFSVYGQDRGLEWPTVANEDEFTLFELAPRDPQLHGRPATATTVATPDRPELLPPELAAFTRRHDYQPGGGRPAVDLGSAHSGSHPHLVHEFVTSIVEDRRPLVDTVTAATWTAPGIAGHESAMHGGDAVEVPDYGVPSTLVHPR
ncbi:MAG TPA: Gfo/Idh/MocA family oxidoreductase [Mycobacteriales bacterium]|nr:Gfo/Idh/MocA family oxidoreductase [Mycobacteriales bacterium]